MTYNRDFVVKSNSNLDTATPKPTPKRVQPSNIPEDMKRVRRWVCWRYEWRTDKKGKGRWTKVPLNPMTLQRAKSDKPETWETFEKALTRYNQSTLLETPVAGIGFMLGDGWGGVDIDHCRDGERWKPAALEVIEKFNTYSEVSPSGKGVKLVFRGSIARGRKEENCRLEIYSSGRFFTVTGDHMEGTPSTVEERQEAADWFLATYFAEDEENGPAPDHSDFTTQPVTEERLKAAYERARNRPYGERFRSLWRGDWEAVYGSQNSADLALVNYLAYELGPDREAIDRAFRQSGLNRKKWEEREDYRRRTLDKSLSQLHRWHEDKKEAPEKAAATPGLYDKYFFDTAGFFAAAEEQIQEYLIQPFMPKGGLNMISGASFAGKTVWLFWLLGRMIRGEQVFGYETTPCDVVYVNGDMNPMNRLGRLFAAGLDGNLKTPGFHYLKEQGDDFNAQQLQMLCDMVWEQRPDKHLLVILDTLRPLLFMNAERGDDLDSVAMTKKIKPFKDFVAKQQGRLTIWFVYHNARSTGEYYGTGAFMNLLDSYWNYVRPDIDKNEATMTIQTREDRHKLDVKYTEGQFEIVLPRMTLIEICDYLIAKQGAKLSQEGLTKELANRATRENVRCAFSHFVDNGILTSHNDRRYSQLVPDATTRYNEMKAKLGWETTPPL